MTTLPSSYGPLMRELLKRAAAVKQPADGTFELTSRCNLSCRMCYVRNKFEDNSVRSRELPASAWLLLARQALENGMVFLLLTGGEVFLRSDFFEIYEPLTRMGFILTLFTNGTLVNKDVAERLAQAPPSCTEITLYGATRATYEAVTGVLGSYARCCGGIEALVARHIPLVLKTTISRHNVCELEAMRQMASNWGVPFYAGWLLSRRRDGRPSDVEDCRLPPADCIVLEATDPASAEEWAELKLRKLPESFYCQAGKGAFFVNSSGEMNVCSQLPLPAARPLKVGFSTAWKQVHEFVDSVPSAAPACLSCDVRSFCGRCPAWSYLETNTLTDPVPYLCQIARARRDHYGQPN